MVEVVLVLLSKNCWGEGLERSCSVRCSLYSEA